MRVRDIRSERPPGLRHEARELDVQPRCRRARPAAEHGPLRNERADLAPDLHAVRAERAVRLAVQQPRSLIQRSAPSRIKIDRQHGCREQRRFRSENGRAPPPVRHLRQHHRARTGKRDPRGRAVTPVQNIERHRRREEQKKIVPALFDRRIHEHRHREREHRAENQRISHRAEIHPGIERPGVGKAPAVRIQSERIPARDLPKRHGAAEKYACSEHTDIDDPFPAPAGYAERRERIEQLCEKAVVPPRAEERFLPPRTESRGNEIPDKKGAGKAEKSARLFHEKARAGAEAHGDTEQPERRRAGIEPEFRRREVCIAVKTGKERKKREKAEYVLVREPFAALLGFVHAAGLLFSRLVDSGRL